MAINKLSSQVSNFTNEFTMDFGFPAVTAGIGDVIQVVFDVAAARPQIVTPPTWNGETFTLTLMHSNAPCRAYVYTLVCTTAGTAPIIAAPESWSQAAGIAHVFRGTINLANPIVTPVITFVDADNPPYVAPSNNITVTDQDLVVSYLFASNQDLGWSDLVGQTFTEGSGQLGRVDITNTASAFVGTVLSTIKPGTNGSVNMSWTQGQNSQYTHVVLAIRGTAGGGGGVTVDTYPAVIRSGQNDVAFTTTGLTTVSSVAVGSLAGTGIESTAGDGTHDIPALADNVVHELYGNKTVTITGAEGSDTIQTFFLPPVGSDYIPLGNNINTTETGIVYNYFPAAAQYDQIVFPDALTVDDEGNVTGNAGTYVIWHISNATKIARFANVVLGGGIASKGKNNWRIANAFRLARVTPMIAIGPINSSGQYAYHKWADTNGLYKVRVCWRGGEPPFRLTMVNGPASAYIGTGGKIQEWNRTQDPDVPTLYHHTLPEKANYVFWQPTSADIGQTVSFTIQVEDQNNQKLLFNWTATVDNTKSIWLDSENGNDANDGSFANPKETLDYCFDTQSNADQYIYRLKNGTYKGGWSVNSGKPKCLLGQGSNVNIDCSIGGGFYGATHDVCLMDLILDGTPPNADNYKVIATSYGTDRRYYHGLTFKNVAPTSSGDNPALIFTPGVPLEDFGNYLAITDCIAVENVSAQLACTYSQNYVIAEMNVGISSIAPGVTSTRFLHFKDQTSYVTERFNYCKGDTAGSGLISFANQYPINAHEQESLYSFLDYTGNVGYSPLMWNGQGTTPPNTGTVMWAQRLSIKADANAPIFAPDYSGGVGEKLQVGSILWSSDGNSIENTDVPDGLTEAYPSSKILANQWDSNMKMVAAVKAANLGKFGAQIASTLVTVPGIAITPIDASTSTRHVLAPNTAVTLTIIKDDTTDVVQDYIGTVDVHGNVYFTNENWVVGQSMEGVLSVGTIKQFITFTVVDV